MDDPKTPIQPNSSELPTLAEQNRVLSDARTTINSESSGGGEADTSDAWEIMLVDTCSGDSGDSGSCDCGGGCGCDDFFHS
jgi:hypothetical protein